MTIDATPPILPSMLEASPGDEEASDFADSLAGPLQEGWQWLREEHTKWAFRGDGIDITMKPGGLWGKVFAELPTPALLLRPLGSANACEVTVVMPSAPGSFGEQAGLFWYFDENNYAKLVVEWMKNGSASIVLARESKDEEPKVFGKIPLDDDEVQEAVRLRLELSSDGLQLSGVMVGAYYMRLVGSCSAKWESALESSGPSVGVSAHGGTDSDDDRIAHLSDFSAICVRPNRVQWDGIGGPVRPQQSPAQAGYAPPGPGAGLAGLTLSPTLSEEERAQVAAMLLAASGEQGDESEEPSAADGQPPP
eukprot:TRINITY_DN98368_c0_g1_i1.p1 TRINITY_DN98368_c0_g1~~TRINITY_DN98368_c0_g1_i1.p1  ORF type:complete len:326 (-),score=91.89 TRINITY_DN98368_c0_g1_i1:52-975(-)